MASIYLKFCRAMIDTVLGRYSEYKNRLWILSFFFIYILSWSLCFFPLALTLISSFLKPCLYGTVYNEYFFTQCRMCNMFNLSKNPMFSWIFTSVFCFYHCSSVSKILWCLFSPTDNINRIKTTVKPLFHWSLLSDDFVLSFHLPYTAEAGLLFNEAVKGFLCSFLNYVL